MKAVAFAYANGVLIPITKTASTRNAIIGNLLIIGFIASSEIKSVLIRISTQISGSCMQV